LNNILDEYDKNIIKILYKNQLMGGMTASKISKITGYSYTKTKNTLYKLEKMKLIIEKITNKNDRYGKPVFQWIPNIERIDYLFKLLEN